MSQQEVMRWPTSSDINVRLQLVAGDGTAVSGKSPEVAIRRFRETYGAMLDLYYWDGASFTNTPTFHTMTELDATGTPGIYTYEFEQTLIGLQHTYLVYFRHTSDPVGFAFEQHIFTDEIYVPVTQPDPIVVGPDTVMGQLELIKDGGSAEFDGTTDSLHSISSSVARILGLVHHNGIVDNQTYDTNRQLTSARLRVFDTATHVPTIPGGNETVGLLHTYQIEAQYGGVGILTRYALKRVV